jgi:hypothetical protein
VPRADAAASPPPTAAIRGPAQLFVHLRYTPVLWRIASIGKPQIFNNIT